MAKVHQNNAEILAERASRPHGFSPNADAPLVASERTTASQLERAAIYRGTMPVPNQPAWTPNVPLPPRKKPVQRKISTFNIILMLIGSAAAIVLYISNIIAVDQLMNDIHKLQDRHQKILNEQEMLKARVNQMSSLERIQKRAEEELGLQTPKQAPIWIKVDREKIEEIEQTVREH